MPAKAESCTHRLRGTPSVCRTAGTAVTAVAPTSKIPPMAARVQQMGSDCSTWSKSENMTCVILWQLIVRQSIQCYKIGRHCCREARAERFGSHFSGGCQCWHWPLLSSPFSPPVVNTTSTSHLLSFQSTHRTDEIIRM